MMLFGTEVNPVTTYYGANYGADWKSYQAASSDPAAQGGSPYMGALARTGLSTLDFSEPVPIEDAGIRAGEIIGYRAWMVGTDGILRSMYVGDYKWRPGHVEYAPNVEDGIFGCGLHAYKDLSLATDTYECYGVWDFVAFGTVALWGRVVEHDYGYRAEYAAVDSIIRVYKLGWRQPRLRWWQFWKEPPPDALEVLRARYGVAPLTPNYAELGGRNECRPIFGHKGTT